MGDTSSFEVSEGEAGEALAAFLRRRLPGRSWRDVKALVASGKVFVGEANERGAGRVLRAGERVEVRMSAPRRAASPPVVRIVHEDTHVVVIDKPAGVASVPFEEREPRSAIDLVREAWRRAGRTPAPVYKVHRLDKATSGLLVYAKTELAERDLFNQFRAHHPDRAYLCVAHGAVAAQRIESCLVKDRGDGLRWEARFPGQGKRSITNVAPLRGLRGATLCEVRPETGRTHQIRIHLAARGHPLVGDPVYGRDFERAGRALIASPRLLLHAATIAFTHPVTGAWIELRADPPPDFQAMVAALEVDATAGPDPHA